MKYNEIKIGDTATIEHTITEKDIEKFVDLTGDDNKLHVSMEFAKHTEFKKPVVHGMLGASFISTLIGTKLPGDGALWFSQTLEFLRPARVGDKITVQAIVVSKNDRSNTIELNVEIVNQNHQVVTSGVSKIKVVEYETEEPLAETAMIETRKSVLLIGASGGVGRSTAMVLAKNGYNLILHYHSNVDAINNLKELVKEYGVTVTVAKANLLDEKQVNLLISMIKRNGAELIGFVNCSTVNIPAVKFKNLSWQNLQDHIDINIKSTFQLLQAIVPIFEQNGGGKIVMLGTLYTDSPVSELLHYITAKSALNGFVKSLAIELATKKINVNLISPGMIDTDLVADVPKKAKLLIEAKTPLRRLCKPEDVAEAVVYLISDKSNFITGETIRINGGTVMI